ncbi:Fusaric acid resistance protein-like-domain-containing protein [Diplogelasinospora grovesii]|uniref:Fusaric acid resistance protein-like-domain-containing protein n=1 Tax=Diplogelasinospora grovesii TaxID=303347 RepID=A0AAN6S628_9PEZI|nr:Fusaric acid resistance protein-like-domain-containing protein [Diplogelasinospora grovesii]
MSSGPAPATGRWPPRRPSKRSKLRNGTFIIPATGERSRRNFTLRNLLSNQVDGGHGSDATTIVPLLSRQSSMLERAHAAAHSVQAGALQLVKWLNTPNGRGVLKCTLAYTLASLATFWSPLSDFLGNLDGKHVVATITVYFHPARTVGSMIEAILVAVVAVAYAVTISTLSMCTSVLFGGVLGMVTLAHVLVLVVFIAGGFGFIGWVKQKMNNPLVNVGSTLASLAIIGVVTKETAVLTNVFSNQKIMQIFKMLIMAITTTTAVNLLLWRVSAVDLLRKSMTKASTSLGEMLAMITSGFLSGSEDDLQSAEFAAASSAYASIYPQLTKNLREAKFERYFLGQERIYQFDRAVVKSMETLAQSIGGLRSAANTQFALLKEPAENKLDSGSAASTLASSTLRGSSSSVLRSGKDRSLSLSAIDEASEESAEDWRNRVNDNSVSDGADASKPSLGHPSEIFDLFIASLGSSMKSLAYTLSEVLRDSPFGSAPNYEISTNDHFRQSLSDALELFNRARAEALQKLYDDLKLGRTRSEKIQADFEEVAAACGHFSFSLQTLGEEMVKYLDVLEDLKHASERKSRSWHWLKWWRRDRARGQKRAALPYEPEESESMIKPIKKTAIPKGIPDSLIARRDTYNWEAAAQKSKVVATLSRRILRLARKLSADEIRFGLKVGIGAALWAMFAFIPQTRDTYQHWRGEWGLLSFMIVCSMTVGAANTTGWARFIGTLIGAAASVLNWNLSQGNAVPLVFLGSLVAFGSFWVIIARGKAPLGRITLLAYNVSTLYAYSLSQTVDDDDDDEGGVRPIIMQIVLHRFLAVTAGILWGLIVCRIIWPISARKKFKEGLSMLYLQMGLIWKRGPLAILLRSDCTRSYLKSGEQAALQKYAARLDALRISAASEFELRGPFPTEQAGRLMKCTYRLLDAFYAMSLITQRRGHLTKGERALLLFTAEERSLLCDRICHVFQVLAASLMLEYPLTDAIPSVAAMRDRLLGKIFQFRKEHSRRLCSTDSPGTAGASSWTSHSDSTGNIMCLTAEECVEERDYALLYAYALVTGQVAEELAVVAKEIEALFGPLNEESLLLQ